MENTQQLPKVNVKYHPEVKRPVTEVEDKTLIILPNGQVSPESFA